MNKSSQFTPAFACTILLVSNTFPLQRKESWCLKTLISWKSNIILAFTFSEHLSLPLYYLFSMRWSDLTTTFKMKAYNWFSVACVNSWCVGVHKLPGWVRFPWAACCANMEKLLLGRSSNEILKQMLKRWINYRNEKGNKMVYEL